MELAYIPVYTTQEIRCVPLEGLGLAYQKAVSDFDRLLIASGNHVEVHRANDSEMVHVKRQMSCQTGPNESPRQHARCRDTSIPSVTHDSMTTVAPASTSFSGGRF